MALAHQLGADRIEPVDVGKRDLLDAAKGLGDELVASAVRDLDDELYWKSWTVDDSWKSSAGKINWIQRSSPYLYDGNAGVSLFLGYLYATTGLSVFAEACRAGLNWALRQHRTHPANWGLFSGGAGLAYVCIECARAVSDPVLEKTGWELLAQVQFTESAGPDVISGIAGALLALVACSKRAPDRDLLRAKVREGARALVHIVDHSHIGSAWRLPLFKAPLTGYAHGTSGVVHAFLEAYSLLGDENWIPYVVGEGLAYEDHYCRRSEGKIDWPDLRNNPRVLPRTAGQSMCMRVWCYGSVGMAYTRLRAYEILGNEQYRDDAIAAWNSSASGVSDSLDLCHGAGGIVELDAEFHRVLGDSKYLDHAANVARYCMATRKRTGTWFNGTSVPPSDPSLMQGLAGMGTALLAAASPGHFSSILFSRSPMIPRGFKEEPGEPPDLSILHDFRHAHISAHFPRTSSLLNSPLYSGTTPPLRDSLDSGASDLLNFYNALRERLEGEGRPEAALFLLDCVDFEKAILDIKLQTPHTKNLFTAPLAPPWNQIDLETVLFVRSPGVRIVRSRWNWKDLFRDDVLAQILTVPAEVPTVFAVFPHEETAEFLRITPLVSLLWTMLTSPMPGAVLVQRCTEQAPDNDRDRLANLLWSQLEQMHNSQIVMLTAQERCGAA